MKSRILSSERGPVPGVAHGVLKPHIVLDQLRLLSEAGNGRVSLSPHLFNLRRKTQENAQKRKQPLINKKILKKVTLWRHLGRALATFWSLLDTLGALLGGCWRLLRRPWDALVAPEAPLGRSLRKNLGAGHLLELNLGPKIHSKCTKLKPKSTKMDVKIVQNRSQK